MVRLLGRRGRHERGARHPGAPGSASEHRSDRRVDLPHRLPRGLVATAVLWILILLVPTPTRFFGWLGVLVTLAATVLPFTYHITNTSKFWLSAINLVTGLVIVSLLIGIVPKVMQARSSASTL